MPLFVILWQMVFSQKISRIIPVDNTSDFSSLGDHFCRTIDEGYCFALENYKKKGFGGPIQLRKHKANGQQIGKLIKYSDDFEVIWSLNFDSLALERDLTLNHQTADLLLTSTDFDEYKKVAKSYVTLIDGQDGQIIKTKKWWELSEYDFNQSKFTSFSNDGSLGVFTCWSIEKKDLEVYLNFLNVGDLSQYKATISKPLQEYKKSFHTFLDSEGVLLMFQDKYKKFLEFNVFNEKGTLSRKINVPFDLTDGRKIDKDFTCHDPSGEVKYFFGNTVKFDHLLEGLDIWSLSKYRDSVAHVAYLDLSLDSEFMNMAFQNYHLNYTNQKQKDKGFKKRSYFDISMFELELSQVSRLDDGFLILLEVVEDGFYGGYPIVIKGAFIVAKIDSQGNIKWVQTFGRNAMTSMVLYYFSKGKSGIRINGILSEEKLRIIYANGKATRMHEIIYRELDLLTGEITDQEILDQNYWSINQNYSNWINFNTFIGLFCLNNKEKKIFEHQIIQMEFPD